MEVTSTPTSPTPEDPMDRESGQAPQQAEEGDREEPRVELKSFTQGEDETERGQAPRWVNQPDQPAEDQRGMRAQPFKGIIRAIERREEGARGDGPWSRKEKEGEISFKDQRGVHRETPTVRHRDWEYGNRGVQTSWPTPQRQEPKHRQIEDQAETQLQILLEQIQTLQAQQTYMQGQAEQAQGGPPQNPWAMTQDQSGAGLPSPQYSTGGDPTRGQGGMATPGQPGFLPTVSPMGNNRTPGPQQTPGAQGQSYMPQPDPYTPGQERRDSGNLPLQVRGADDGYQTGPIDNRGTPSGWEQSKRRRQILPERYDGTNVELREYLNQFLVLTKLNDWTEQEKGLYLASSLTGVARGILNDMTPMEREDFDSLAQKLQQRFEPACREEAFRAELRVRQRRRTETPSEFGHAVKNLVTKAYPDLNERAKETIALEAYWNGHPDGEMRVMALMKAPKTVEEAGGFVTQYESVKPAPTGRRVSKPINAVQADQEEGSSKWDQMADLLIGAVTTNKPKDGVNKPTEGKWPNRTGGGGNWRKDQPNRPSLAEVLTSALKKALEDPLKKIDGVLELMQKFQRDKKPGTERVLTDKEKGVNESSEASNSREPKRAWNFNRRSPNPATSDTECWRCKNKGHYARDCPLKAQMCATMMEWIMQSDDPEMVAPAPEPEDEEEEQEAAAEALLENFKGL